MDSEKIIIYIVIGIAYYGYKYFAKNFGTSKNPSKPVASPSTNIPSFPRGKENEELRQEPKIEKSIFDLLEEIKSKEAEKEPLPKHKQPIFTENRPETIDYELEPQKLVVEDVNPYSYTAKSSSAPNKSSIAKTNTLMESPMDKKPHPILATLKNSSKVKEAFILGEILTKRYS